MLLAQDSSLLLSLSHYTKSIFPYQRYFEKRRMMENMNLGFLFLRQNNFSPLNLRNWIALANSPGKQQQVWKGPTKGKNVTHVYFILACKEGSGILTSFLLVFITSNIPLLQIQVSVMNYTLLCLYSESVRFAFNCNPMFQFYPAQSQPGEYLHCLEPSESKNF